MAWARRGWWLLLIGLWSGVTWSKAPIDLSPTERDWLAANPNILLGAEASWRPFVIPGADGKVSGIEADVIERINQLTGANIKLVLGDWIDMLSQARAGQLHGVALSVEHSERTDQFRFSNSLYGAYYYIYSRGGLNSPYRSPKDLVGKRVGYLQTSLAEKKLLEQWDGVIPVPLATSDHLPLSLLQDKVDAVLANITLQVRILNIDYPGLGIAFVAPGSEVKLRYTIRKEHAALLSILNKAIAAIDRSEIAAIQQRWLGKDLPDAVIDFDLTLSEKDWLKALPEVRVRVADYPPYHWWEGEAKGISVDILKLIAQRAGFAIRFVHGGSWSQALDAIRQKRDIDLLLTAKPTPERLGFLAFSRDYLELPWVIMTRRNDEHRVFTLEDLSGKTVAIEAGYVLQERLAREFPTIRQLRVKDASEALNAVLQEKADAYAGNLTVAQFVIERDGLGNLKVAAPVDLGVHTQAFAVRKDWAPLAKILDKGLDNITAEERAAIYRNYFALDAGSLVDARKLAMLGALALLGFLGILAWNLALNHRVQRRTRELDGANRRLRLLARDLGLVEESERRRLAIELHDSPMQKLALVQMHLSALCNSESRNGRAQHCPTSLELLRETIHELRTLQFQLSPPLLYREGLPGALEWLANHATEKLGISTRFEWQEKACELPTDLAVLLFQCVRELLHNVVKHAEASRCTIRLQVQNGDLLVEVEDNGRGVQAMPADERSVEQGGFGLFSIGERLALHHAHLSLHPNEQGTCARIRLPLTEC